MVKEQMTGKRDESVLHSAVRSGSLGLVLEIIGGINELDEEGLKDLVGRRNHLGETALYVAAESGFVEAVKAILRSCDVQLAGVKATNGFDAFHIAAKNGRLEVMKALLQVDLELSRTCCDPWNTTALHTAASRGHTQVVNFLLENVTNLTAIPMSNGKTCLHSAARKGHLDIMKSILTHAPGIATMVDRKGQTPLHMASKGLSVDVVSELLHTDPSLIHIVDAKGYTALDIATRKGRIEIVRILMKAQPAANSAKDELKQTVSDIKDEVHDQIHHTRQTRKRVQGMAKRVNTMHTEGLNNAINSTTVVAVLIATIAFAAIFNIPGQFADSSKDMMMSGSTVSPGQARIGSQLPFMIFIVFDSMALFISLAVVVVQTSLVVVEKKAKKVLMSIMSKVMWLACGLISVAFLAIAFIVVGDGDGRWMAVFVSVLGALILVPTLATLCYWVIMNRRLQASEMRNIRRSGSLSMSLQNVSDSEVVTADHFQLNQMYAV